MSAKKVNLPYTVLLDPALAEWAESLPGGLSSVAERLLRAEYEAAHTEASSRVSEELRAMAREARRQYAAGMCEEWPLPDRTE